MCEVASFFENVIGLDLTVSIHATSSWDVAKIYVKYPRFLAPKVDSPSKPRKTLGWWSCRQTPDLNFKTASVLEWTCSFW